MVAVVQSKSSLEKCQGLARVLTITKQMFVHANEGEWEQVTELELARRGDLENCFHDAGRVEDEELLAEAFATLFHINEELMAKVKTARDEVIVQGRKYSRNRNAVECYREFESDF